jgi:hypothetical protein
MKLERVHKSIYAHDSFGEETFYQQFRRCMSLDVRIKLAVYFCSEIPTSNYRALLLNYLRDIREE